MEFLQQVARFWPLLLLIVVAVAGWWFANRRKIQQHKAAAENLGWKYSYMRPGRRFAYRDLPFIFHEAKLERVRHFVHGEHRGRPITAFTYLFDVARRRRRGFNLFGSDRDERRDRDVYSETHDYGVVTVGLPAKLPALEIVARDIVSRWARERGWTVTRVLGEQAAALLGGVVETGDKAFDDVFVVKTRHMNFARELLTDDARAWLLKARRAREMPAVIDGDEIITWGPATSIDRAVFKANYLNDLLDQLPQSVLSSGK